MWYYMVVCAASVEVSSPPAFPRHSSILTIAPLALFIFTLINLTVAPPLSPRSSAKSSAEEEGLFLDACASVDVSSPPAFPRHSSILPIALALFRFTH